MKFIPQPHCARLIELAEATYERKCLNNYLLDRLESIPFDEIRLPSPLARYISKGLACTTGSALDEDPPTLDECLAAFLLPNCSNLTAGARAWSKHAHRSGGSSGGVTSDDSWWGKPKGPVVIINEKARVLFWRIWEEATWRNLHWLPHQVLVYEIRVPEGYGMRWSQDRSVVEGDAAPRLWLFRGYVEPMMENGHEIGWRH